ncbi:hypothetical protein KEM52_003958, partial [Ascosphaera acerosa]
PFARWFSGTHAQATTGAARYPRGWLAKLTSWAGYGGRSGLTATSPLPSPAVARTSASQSPRLSLSLRRPPPTAVRSTAPDGEEFEDIELASVEVAEEASPQTPEEPQEPEQPKQPTRETPYFTEP